jgi:hypothetical protein
MHACKYVFVCMYDLRIHTQVASYCMYTAKHGVTFRRTISVRSYDHIPELKMFKCIQQSAVTNVTRQIHAVFVQSDGYGRFCLVLSNEAKW